MKSAENLIRALTRALLANNDLEPEIEIHEKRGICLVEVDVNPFDPAPMIGTGGTMKFAIQTMLAGEGHPSNFQIVFRKSGRLMSPRLRDVKPDTGAMQAVLTAAVNHWKNLGIQTSSQVEMAKTTVIGILTMDNRMAEAQRGAVSRIARAIGKANGYRATCIIEKPATVAT